MTQLKDDCFAHDDRLIPMAEALEMLSGRLLPINETSTLPLPDCLGRILAADIFSTINVPAQDNSAVDGYAIRHQDLTSEADSRLPLKGKSAAGHPMREALAPGTAARIFTGGALPRDADSVVMQEDVRIDGDHIVIPDGLKLGANRRKAGEDTKTGALVLPRGQRIRPQDIGIAASTGHAELPVFRRLRVALFSSGDELVEPGNLLAEGGVFDSNRYLIRSLLKNLDCKVSDIGILPDKLDKVRDGIAEAAQNHDLLITSGGMSTGEEDHIKAAVEALGSLYFWRLAIKPGRPVALGQAGGTAFIGLPGNPVAAMVCFLRFARPIILELNGGNNKTRATRFFAVPAGFSLNKKPDRREWLRAKLTTAKNGRVIAEMFPSQGSGVLRSMVESDGLVEIPESTTEIKPGDLVDFLPFNEVLF